MFPLQGKNVTNIHVKMKKNLGGTDGIANYIVGWEPTLEPGSSAFFSGTQPLTFIQAKRKHL